MNLRTLGLTKILLTFIILSIIGALMIYSASSYDLLMQGVKPTAVFIKQGIIMCLSWVLMFVIYKVRLEVLFNKKIAIGLLLVSVLLLLMVRLPFFWCSSEWRTTLDFSLWNPISAIRTL